MIGDGKDAEDVTTTRLNTNGDRCRYICNEST